MSQTQPTTVRVRIYNQTYNLVNSEGQDPEYTRLAASYLDEKMQQIAAISGPRPLDIAILAALNIADEVLRARQHKDALLNQTDARLDSFNRLLSDAPATTDSPSTDSTDSKRF